MPSAHRPIFFRIQLREKNWVKIFFFIRLFQCTQLDFLSQTKIGVIVLWQWQTRSHCWIMLLRFVIRLKLVHTIPFFVADKLSDRKIRFFNGPNVGAHDSIFTQSVCVRWAWAVWMTQIYLLERSRVRRVILAPPEGDPQSHPVKPCNELAI